MGEQFRSRNIQIHFFLDEAEYERFLKMKEKSGLTTSEFLRQLVTGCQINEAPPVDYWDMVKQIRHYGYTMNQIAKRVNLFGVPDVEAYQRNADEVFAILERIENAVLSKRKD